jgi:polysaccharide biosynthesis transport protein
MSNNGSVPDARVGQTAAPPFSLHEFLAIVVSRWWLIVLFAGVGAGAAYWFDSNRVDTYTAEGLLQRRATANAEALGVATSSDALNMNSEVQIIQSRALIADAVKSAGLRLIVSPVGLRQEIQGSPIVDPAAPPGIYQVVRADKGAALKSPSGVEIARAEPGGTLAGPGFQLQIDPNGFDMVEPGTIEILTNEAAESKVGSSALSVENEWSSNLIRIWFTDGDPVYAMSVVNAVADAYIRHDSRRARDEAVRRLDLVDSQLGQLRDSLMQARDGLLRYQSQFSAIDPTEFSNRLNGAEEDQEQLRRQVGVLDGIAAMLRANQTDQAFQRVAVEAAEFVPTGTALYERYRSRQEERQGLTAGRGYTDGNQQVQTVDSLLKATRDELLSIVVETARVRRQAVDDIGGQVTALRKEMSVIPQQNATASELRDRVDAVQRTYDQMADRRHEAYINAEVASGDVELVDPAVVPLGPDPMGRTTVALGVGIGLLLGIAFAFMLENLNSSVRRSGDVERATGFPLLALIPRAASREHGKSGRRVGLVEDETSLESFRILRTSVDFLQSAKPHAILAVTSSRPKEGKSTVASNLAASYARQRKRVLLIDADLRRPTLHTILGTARGPGLSEILTGATQLATALRNVETGLTFIGCGNPVHDPAELLSSARLAQLLEHCRPHFDLIVIDTPPMLAVADSSVVCAATDGVLLIARAGVTPREVLQRTANELRKLPVTTLGVVLNGAPTTRWFSRYAGYSSYYYSFDTYTDYYLKPDKAEKRSRKSKNGKPGAPTPQGARESASMFESAARRSRDS